MIFLYTSIEIIMYYRLVVTFFVLLMSAIAVSAQEQENIMQELHEQKLQSYRERIEMLTEKFKNDPTKLAVLSKCAQDLNTAVE